MPDFYSHLYLRGTAEGLPPRYCGLLDDCLLKNNLETFAGHIGIPVPFNYLEGRR